MSFHPNYSLLPFELVLKDDNNRRVARFKAYATYMYKYLFSVYKEKETEVREQLEETVNTIFKEIYNGGFSLKLDDKYNIQIPTLLPILSSAISPSVSLMKMITCSATLGSASHTVFILVLSNADNG